MSTPLEISIALHYWTRAGDYGLGSGDNNFNAPAVVEQRRQMIEAGLLQKSSDGSRCYEAGPALEVYVSALCGVPWPIQKWVMP